MSVQNAPLADHQRMFGPKRSRVFVSVAGLACLLVSCGGAADVDIATVDVDLADSEPTVEIVTGAADLPTDLPAPDVDDSISVVAVAPLPPEPGASSSPAERQRLQTQAIPGMDPETGAFERLPIPEEDLDDASNPANATPVPIAPPARADLHLFPSTIPVESESAAPALVASGEEASGSADGPAVEGFDESEASGFPEGYYEDDFFAGVEESVLNTEPPVELDSNSGVDGGSAVDETIDSDSGGEDVTPAEGDAADRAPDCDARPWDLGCDTPDSLFERNVEPALTADEAELGDAEVGSGVVVSQEVIDLLLSPADNTVETSVD